VIHRLHGIVCGAVHRMALRDSVIKGCEDVLHCRWVQPELPDELHWYELDEHNGEIDLWTDHDETLISIDVNRGFRLHDKPVGAVQIERLLAAAMAARMHRALWGMALRGRRGTRYLVDDRGQAGGETEAETYGDPALRAWAEGDARRSGARSAVGEDEYVRSYMEAYRRRRVGGHHPTPPEEVEAKMRNEYRRTLAKFERYEPDTEMLFFVV